MHIHLEIKIKDLETGKYNILEGDAETLVRKMKVRSFDKSKTLQGYMRAVLRRVKVTNPELKVKWLNSCGDFIKVLKQQGIIE